MIKPAFLLASLVAAASLLGPEARAQFSSHQGAAPRFGGRPISGNPSAPSDWRGTGQARRGAPSDFRGTAQGQRGPQSTQRPQQTTQPQQQAQPQGSTLRDLRYGRQRKETKRIDPRDVYRQGERRGGEGGGDGGGGGY
jgi:hypothetical protein